CARRGAGSGYFDYW
nr:immunoglobulin heavy chain junction region [Mus musculus]NSM03718.1 immunoglobulin heavy chain junction region [Mus musculus]NSM03950.1 immunoglobulin heavy chain junction region [Mus musculus]NSM04052.1 immunoglobulin heavy chain junction region [Mus musculus]NSM04569.1 immunoglobulin heavy chain junction region [Mus musculus]